MDRRTLLRRGFQAMGAIVAGAVGVPALILGLGPMWQERRRELWVPLGALEDYGIGEVSKALVVLPEGAAQRPVAERGVFVWRPEPEQLVVFSRNCTDLSCPITWDLGSNWFYCPCHGGIFAVDGTPQAGPPSRPLFRYALRVREGTLEIDLDSVPPMV